MIKPKEFFSLGKLHIGPMIVLGYFNFGMVSGFYPNIYKYKSPSNTELLDARGAAIQ